MLDLLEILLPEGGSSWPSFGGYQLLDVSPGAVDPIGKFVDKIFMYQSINIISDVDMGQEGKRTCFNPLSSPLSSAF